MIPILSHQVDKCPQKIYNTLQLTQDDNYKKEILANISYYLQISLDLRKYSSHLAPEY